LYDFYRELCNIRKNESAFRRGTRGTVFAAEEVLAYRRMDNGNSVLCVMNISNKTSDLEMDITEITLLLATSSECRIQVEGHMKRLVLPPFSGMILK